MELPNLISQNTQRIDLPDLPSPQPNLDAFDEMAGPADFSGLLDPNQVTPQKITFTMLQQPENSSWCWAAVAVSVSRHLNPASAWTMASLVDKAFNKNGCTPAIPECNQQWCLQNALNITGNFCKYTQELSDAELFMISEQLEKNRPLPCLTYLPNSGPHFVVITAIYLKNGEPWVTIEDPQEDAEIEDSVANFRTSYKKKGRWEFTFFTKKEAGNGS